MQGIQAWFGNAAKAIAAGTLFIAMGGFATALGRTAFWSLSSQDTATRQQLIDPLMFAVASLGVLMFGELLRFAYGAGQLRDVPAAAWRTFRGLWLGLVHALGLTRFRLRWLRLIALATLLAFLINLAVTWVLDIPADPTDARFLATDTLSPLARGIAFAVGGAPEEFLYRGPVLIAAALTSGMTSRKWRGAMVLGVLLASSALFGDSHPGLDNMLSAGLSGLIWGGLSLLTRSIWPALLSHALHNLIVGILT